MAYNIQHLLLCVVVFVLILYSLNVLWRRRWLYIHSWNVPGPLCLPFIGISYKFLFSKDDAMDLFLKTAKNYPSPWKGWFCGKLIFAICEPDQIEKVLTHPNCQGKDDFYDHITDALGAGLLTAPTVEWKRHRKVIMPSFNQKVLDDFVGVFVKQTLIFTRTMEKYVGRKDINVVDLLGPLFLDIICESIMGTEIDAQGGNDALIGHAHNILEIIALKNFSIWGQWKWTWRLHPMYRESRKVSAEINKTTQMVIKKKREAIERKKHSRNAVVAHTEAEEAPQKKPAFLDLLMENSGFTDIELQDEVEIFIIAGFDTTTKTACYMLEMLALYPDIQQKVYEEVVEVVGENRDVEPADLPDLKYTERVMKETLRVFPVGLLYSRLIDEDIQIGKYTLPRGATALFNTVVMHRNPEYWPEPLKFDPDRFLPEEVAKRHPCTYLPFSYGPRSCIGGKYGIMEIKAVVATIIKKYKMLTLYKSIEEIEVLCTTISFPKNGFKVYFESR